MVSAEQHRRNVKRNEDVQVALDRLDAILQPSHYGLTGGDRVAARDVLEALWEGGRIQGVWEPVPEVTVTVPGAEPAQARDPEPDAVSALRGWWEQTAHDEVAQLTEKMVEYGGLSRATDLAEIGRGLVNSGVKIHEGFLPGSARTEAWYQELGCYFYLLGKFARWTAAVAEGRPVSDDTLLDIGIYVRMVQRIRAVGGWPV